MKATIFLVFILFVTAILLFLVSSRKAVVRTSVNPPVIQNVAPIPNSISEKVSTSAEPLRSGLSCPSHSIMTFSGHNVFIVFSV